MNDGKIIFYDVVKMNKKWNCKSNWTVSIILRSGGGAEVRAQCNQISDCDWGAAMVHRGMYLVTRRSSDR